MKRLFLILLIPILMSSCASTYFFSTISSLSEDLFQTETGDFISDSDSLLVAYWFNGENMPISINVYNKSRKPLYIDWGRSSIIVGDKAITYRNRLISIDDDESYGSLVHEAASFIPPMSRRTFVTRCLSNFEYGNMEGQYFKKTSIPDNSGVPVEVKMLEFSRNTTPLKFRSYLSFYTSNYNDTFSTEHEFYISSLIKTNKISLQTLPEDKSARGDMFYIEKVSKNKVFGTTVLGATFLVGLGAVELVLSPDEGE